MFEDVITYTNITIALVSNTNVVNRFTPICHQLLKTSNHHLIELLLLNAVFVLVVHLGAFVVLLYPQLIKLGRVYSSQQIVGLSGGWSVRWLVCQVIGLSG